MKRDELSIEVTASTEARPRDAQVSDAALVVSGSGKKRGRPSELVRRGLVQAGSPEAGIGVTATIKLQVEILARKARHSPYVSIAEMHRRYLVQHCAREVTEDGEVVTLGTRITYAKSAYHFKAVRLNTKRSVRASKSRLADGDTQKYMPDNGEWYPSAAAGKLLERLARQCLLLTGPHLPGETDGEDARRGKRGHTRVRKGAVGSSSDE